ncbi:hypothetical protein AG1IA_00656 [Rhizoctonia solani AG-1 IA]|uniref:Uncharacterized protein n=1 Tax=Thanatephorus cucumeris (strain AG1-IA) TaxID=983506 RepID=L8X9H1_THACA|nr:hypothetical protein AG1IA_00656 [Rhizoctonia solani AG-1 IA]
MHCRYDIGLECMLRRVIAVFENEVEAGKCLCVFCEDRINGFVQKVLAIT